MKIFKTIILSLFLFHIAFAYNDISMSDRQGHFYFADSSKDKKLFIRFSAVDSMRASFMTPKIYFHSFILKGRLEGHLYDNLFFNSAVSLFMDRSNAPIIEGSYDPADGIPFTKESENTYNWAQVQTNLKYETKYGNFLAGMDRLQWGTAKRNPLILRGETQFYRPWSDSTTFIFEPASTPYFGYELNFGPLQYTQYAAKLSQKKNKLKYLNAHRLQMNLPFDVEIGVSEMTVYGSTTEKANTNPNLDADSADRHFEWIYAIPLLPYMFAEPFLGDLDNNALAFDFKVNAFKNWELYGEIFLDDLLNPLSAFNSDWWGDKWAASIGVTKSGLCLSSVCFTFNAEYTRIEPWVYTHHKGDGYTYQNYGSSLGSDLGPNAQEIYTSLSADYKKFGFKLEASRVDKDTAFGGKINDIHGPLSSNKKRFLDPKSTIHYKELKAAVFYSPYDFLWGSFRYSYYFKDYKGYRLESSLGLTW